MPWFSFEAIDFLAKHITSEMDVFEYGGGGSTVFFARRAHEVWSTEDDASWYGRILKHIEREGLRNVVLQHHPFDYKDSDKFNSSSYLHSIPPRKFDIISVDGMEKGVKLRPRCFAHALSYIKQGGIIVVDDAWRYPELHDVPGFKHWREFRSPGPCRPGVTTTEVFFC